MSVREPAVAGTFYGSRQLDREVESCFAADRGPGSLPEVRVATDRKILGLVSPHAGYAYSGAVAAHAYHALAEDGLPNVAVIIGPNHRSYLPPVALTDDAAWRTPIGESAVDLHVVEQIMHACAGTAVSSAAHAGEHSIEVQLPFLQYIGNRAGGRRTTIVPVLVGASLHMYGESRLADFVCDLGSTIAEALSGREAVVVASTDFTHYEPTSTARAQDDLAISRILELDEAGLLRVVREHDISMCGVLPTAIAIAACKAMGATSADLLAYSTSGDVTGDDMEVVGYAALKITR